MDDGGLSPSHHRTTTIVTVVLHATELPVYLEEIPLQTRKNPATVARQKTRKIGKTTDIRGNNQLSRFANCGNQRVRTLCIDLVGGSVFGISLAEAVVDDDGADEQHEDGHANTNGHLGPFRQDCPRFRPAAAYRCYNMRGSEGCDEELFLVSFLPVYQSNLEKVGRKIMKGQMPPDKNQSKSWKIIPDRTVLPGDIFNTTKHLHEGAAENFPSAMLKGWTMMLENCSSIEGV